MHRRRLLALVLGLAVLAIVARRALAPPPASDPLDVAPAALGAAPDEEAAELVGTDPELPLRESVAAAAGPSPTAIDEPAESADAAGELCILEGAAVRLDPGGAEHTGDDGAFVVHWRRRADAERREVAVAGGRWSLEVPPDVELAISEFVLAGVPLSPEREHCPVPADRFLVLRGAARVGVLLHVVAADGGRALEDVEVWRSRGSFPTAARHPGVGFDGPAVARGASPVVVEPPARAWRAEVQYFVRAPGFAYGTIALDHSAGGERTLELEPECALEVELRGSAEWLEPQVRLWPPDASRWAAYAFAEREPDATGRARFEALPPGTYVASVERGWADRRVSYGSESVTLAAGERRSVAIDVELPPGPVAVHVGGTLTLPRAWDRDGVKLTFGGEGAVETWLGEELGVALGAMTPLASAPAGCDAFAWEAELPCAGSYRLEVFPLLVRQLLEVPPEGLVGVVVDVPPPSEVEVRVVDVATGDELHVESLHWSTPPIDGIQSTPLYTAVTDPASGRVKFRAPAGELRLSTPGLDVVPAEREPRFRAEPGPCSLELRVRRQYGARITLMDGEAALPWSWGWRLSAHQVAGEARDTGRSIGHLWFPEPGTYELRAEGGVPGYRSIDGFTFDVVQEGGPVDVVVPLTRE